MTSAHSVSDTVSAALRDATVLDVDGDTVRLGDLWSERPAVLVFVRHYG
ncbi:MAG: hypothetical protein AAGC60_10545 [Acidobacteriota bacterium]